MKHIFVCSKCFKNFEQLTENLIRKEKTSLVGFGSFYVEARPVMLVPRNKKKEPIPLGYDKNHPVFNPTKGLTDAVNK